MTDSRFSVTGALGQQAIVDSVTVVTAIEGAGALTKIWRGAGGETVEPAAEVSLFHYESFPVDALENLAALLEQLARSPRSAIIRGKLKSDLAPWMPHPRRSRLSGRGEPTVDDVPRYWCGVDLDDLPVAPWLTPEQIAVYARNLLPYPFSAAPCVWQLSASSGSAKKRAAGVAGVHLWFWLAEPRSSADLRAYFSSYPAVDRSLFKAVGLHFTADPVVLDGGEDPYAGRRLGILEGFSLPSVPALPKASVPSVPLRREGAAVAGSDPAAIERFVSAMDRSGALRSKTGTVRREARLAFLDVLVNDLGFDGDEDALREAFMRVCVGDGDEDGESDYLEALNWMERPNADRIGVGSLFLEAEGAAMARGDQALLHELKTIKNERHRAQQPDLMAAMTEAGIPATGIMTKAAPALAAEGAPKSALMAAMAAAGVSMAGVSSADIEAGEDARVKPAQAANDDGEIISAMEDASQLLDGGDGEGETFERWVETPQGGRISVPVLASYDQKTIALKGEINTRRMLKFLRYELRWNAWLGRHEVRHYGLGGSGKWESLTDDHLGAILNAAHNPSYEFPVVQADFYRAIFAIANRNKFDPAAEYLHGLPARDVDGELTLDNWLPRITGCEDSPYMRAVGRYMIGSSIRRILVPGCKSDEMAVLISKAQGIGKSTLCSMMAIPIGTGDDPTHIDSLPLGADSKEVLEMTGGVAIVEFSENASARGKEVEHIKRMLSATQDKGRMAYARLPITRQRRFIMISTTNDETPLRDESGNRRFLPVRLPDDRPIDLDGFMAVREALWRQAVDELVASDMQETFRLPRELWDDAKARQAECMGKTVAEELMQDMFGIEAEVGTEWVSSKDVSMWRSKHARMPDQTFGGAMRRLGFERRLVRVGTRVDRRWVREGADGLQGATQFTYNHERGTFERMALTAASGALAEFKPGG